MSKQQSVTHPYQGHYLQAAFEGYVHFVSTQPAAITAFLEENPGFSAPKSPMDAMIDEATGRNREWAQKFVDWCLVQFGTPEDLERMRGEDDA